MRQAFILIALCYAFVSAENLLSMCRPGICRVIPCPIIAPCTSNQMLIKRATRCRCCNVCVPLLRRGETCLSPRRNPAVGRCMRGLRCLNRRCAVQKPHRHRGH